MSSKFNAFIGTALQKQNAISSKHLGDRSQYVGGSDVGQCLRKATLNKVAEVNYDNKTLLRFLRGHAVQNLFSEIFKSGEAKFEEEVEVVHPHKSHIKVHIDFVFKSQKRFYVVEMKSCDGIPEEPRTSHLDQLSLQMGLLRLVTPADITIEGCILYVDINAGAWKVCNGYNADSPEIQALYTESERRAGIIWEALITYQEPEPEPGFLCAFCSFRTGCPAHQMEELVLPEDVVDALHTYSALQKEKKAVETKMDILKNNLLGYTGEKFNGKCNSVGINVYTVAPSEAVDSRKLKAKFPEVYKEVTKPRAGYTKMEVTTFDVEEVPSCESV